LKLVDERPEAHVPLIKRLGPGLITGAADDDPSGIATYSQAGAKYGYALLWSVLFTTPLMIGIQIISARIGRVTGHGLAANIREHFPRPLLYLIVGLLAAANTLNIAADLGAMGNALELIAGGRSEIYIVLFALVSLSLQIFIPFPRYSPFLKWLTLGLLAYVATLLVVHIPLEGLLAGAFLPHLSLSGEYAALFVAVLGTTISPYLFFWQASQEVEEQRATAGHEPLREAPEQARAHLRRIKFDTYIGMIYSNVIALCIMLTTAVTLHAAGITEISTAEQAAQALRPIAGPFAFELFALGIIGTGLLAVPVLAGSAAYAVAETMRWPIGLGLTLLEARGFYLILSASTALGVAIDFSGVDSIRMLLWAAMVNGVISVPIMVVMMLLAVKPAVMGPFVIGTRLRVLGWLATGVMAAAVAAMFALN
jgi:NRAMP (natural resistance-associated macrophage protein)-like metal ion transporter